MSHWIDASVNEFCRGMGLDAVDFSSAGRVQLDFEQSGTLHIERHGEQLWVSSDEIWKVSNAMELTAVQQKIDFFREFHKLVRAIPIAGRRPAPASP